MSDYKTELQSNNVDLQSVLETVRALPEASSGIKTATVTFMRTAGDKLASSVLYINANGEPVTEVGFGNLKSGGTLTMMCPSFFMYEFNGERFTSASGGVSQSDMDSVSGFVGDEVMFFVGGDGVLTVEPFGQVEK